MSDVHPAREQPARPAAGAAFRSENKDEIRDLDDCVEQADSDAARDRCADRFERQLERN